MPKRQKISLDLILKITQSPNLTNKEKKTFLKWAIIKKQPKNKGWFTLTNISIFWNFLRDLF